MIADVDTLLWGNLFPKPNAHVDLEFKGTIALGRGFGTHADWYIRQYLTLLCNLVDIIARLS